MSLIHQIKMDDDKAFEEAFNTYHRKLYYYVLSKTQSDFQAEEIVQLTFIKLWKYRSSLNEELPLSAQIFRITKTVLIDQFRKECLNINLKNNLGTNPTFEVNAATSNLFKSDLIKHLQYRLNQMPPVRRKVFELSRFEELSHKEIASRLSISPKTVENHINLSLKYLRKYFTLPFLLFILLAAQTFD